MRKTVACMLSLMLLLSACGEEQVERSPGNYSRWINQLNRDWAGEQAYEQSLQRDLARWYNINLCAKQPEAGYEQAYNRILYYDGGVMGYAQIPKMRLYIPIFHGTGEGGFSHDSDSAFPVGGGESNCVLTCDVFLELAEGDEVIIWILGEPETYMVGREGESQCTLICADARYICGRVVED